LMGTGMEWYYPTGMYPLPSLAESECVFVWVIIFDINIILHHTITSFRMTLHHTSYRISNKTMDKEKCFSQNMQWIMKQCAEA
jgi:hypothetical protein